MLDHNTKLSRINTDLNLMKVLVLNTHHVISINKKSTNSKNKKSIIDLKKYFVDREEVVRIEKFNFFKNLISNIKLYIN